MDMSIAALASIRPTLRLNRKEVDRRLGYPGQLSTSFKQCVDRDSFVCLSGKRTGSLSLAYRLQQIDQYIRLHTKIISIKFGR